MRQASVVIGLGFGDEGKGLTTDYLCSRVDDTIVVRFSGGQQAGHNVVLNGVQHIHSNFGSGSLRGMPSYFSEHCSVYLNTIERERDVLHDKGVLPRLYVHPLTKITTPYDVIFGRMREAKKGHGSCGLGIGATQARHNAGYHLYAMDLEYTNMAIEKMHLINDWYKSQLPEDDRPTYASLVMKEWGNFYKLMMNLPFEICDYEMLKNYEQVVFEGSQGIMLDKDFGIFPHVTYANTTSKNAHEVCSKLELRPKIYYVTRCYTTRHGNGWMGSKGLITLQNNEKETNIWNEYQTNFRVSELDYKMLDHAVAVDNLFSEGFPRHLVVTCIDQRPGFEFDHSQIRIPFKTMITSHSPESKDMVTHSLTGKKFANGD